MSGTLRKASSYSFNQAAPAAVWTIDHNFGRTPAVTVFINHGGKLQTVLPLSVEVVTENQVVVRFSAAQSGSARLV